MATMRFHPPGKNYEKGKLKNIKPKYRKYKKLFWISFFVNLLLIIFILKLPILIKITTYINEVL